MPIEGGLRGKLAVGTKLVARYKGAEHTVEVVANDDGKPRYRLANGQEFKSPSAAGSAVMNGQAANGWRFWSVAGTEQVPAPKAAKAPQSARVAPPRPVAVASDEVPAPASTAKVRPQCARCGKQFVGATQLAHHEANADRLCTPA